MEYFDDLLKQPSLFIDESKLDANFIPEHIPHREKDLSLLSQLFLSVITNPFTISRKVLITGDKNSGKTTTLRAFTNILKNAAQKRDVKLDYVYINCRIEQTTHRVLVKIIRKMKKNFPEKGYSNAEILDKIEALLKKQKLYLLIILDDLDSLKSETQDIIYLLSHLYEEELNSTQHLSIIAIIQNLKDLANLTVDSKKMLERNIITFKSYTQEQIFYILKYRAEISLKKSVISDEALKLIAEIAHRKGDIKEGINILWRSVKIAESQNLRSISVESVKLGAETKKIE